MADKPEIIISIDVEATGTSPATASCNMIGAVAVLAGVDPDEKDYVVSKLRLCIEELPNRPMDDRCRREFWERNDENKALLNYIRENAEPPADAMKRFADWYSELLKSYDCWNFLMRPSSFDWQWVNCLYDEFGPKDKPDLPFSHLCLTTAQKFFAHLSGIPVREIRQRIVCPNVKHTHYADDDAHEQAYCYLKLLTLSKNCTQVNAQAF